MTDRQVLRAAARDVRRIMNRRQAENQAVLIAAGDPSARSAPDPDLLSLAVECDAVVFGVRPEASNLRDRLAAVLGDDWEPWSVR